MSSAAPRPGPGPSASASRQQAPPRLLFISLTNSVAGGERTIGEMAGNGTECAVLSPPNYYCQETKFAQHRFLLPPQFRMWFANLFVWPALEIILRVWQPDLILPLDNIAASLLMGLAVRSRTSARLRQLLLRSLGSARGFQPASSRAELVKLAEQIGLKHAVSRSTGDMGSLDDTIASVGYPVVIKQEWTCGGCGVTIAADERAVRRAIAVGQWQRTSIKRLRHLARQLMWSAAGQLPLTTDLIQIQSFVKGRLAIRTVAAWEGQELEGASFLAECVHPSPTGSSTVVLPFAHSEMEQATKRLVAALGCSGIVSFDFVIGESNQEAYLIEMNSRPIGVTHLGRLFGRDICKALLEQLGWQAIPNGAFTPKPDAVALFPREVERNSNSAWLFRVGTVHDVPWEDSGLLESYVRTRLRNQSRT
jgi:hypothetical protein